MDLPNEILYIIACDNAITFCKMATAIPFIGRIMLNNDMLTDYKKITHEKNTIIHYIKSYNGSYVEHRDDGPAFMGFYSGEYREFWYKGGILHRDYWPAFTIYNSTYDSYIFIWFRYGVCEHGIILCEREKSISYSPINKKGYYDIDYEKNIDLVNQMLEFGKDSQKNITYNNLGQ